MRLALLAALALAGCSFLDRGPGPPRAAAPGEVAGTVMWDRIGAEPEHAEQLAQATCASHGLEAQPQTSRAAGPIAVMRYACR